MALVLADRVQQTGTANTTVSFTLSGSVTGFQSFAVIGNSNTTYYSAFDNAGNWEAGIGTYSTTGPTLTRTTILSSSNSGAAVTFSGTVNVFVTYPSEKSVNLDADGVMVVGEPIGYSDTGIIATFASTVAGYNQLVVQNKSSDPSASSNINVSHNSATDTEGYAELGINSTTFSGTGSFSIPGASYLASASTDLTIGTYGAYDLHFVTNSNTTDSMTIFDDGGVSLGGLTSPGLGNIACNNINLKFQQITTTGGTTALTNASPYYTQFTGTNTQILQLPDATTCLPGTTFIFDNDSTQDVDIADGAGTVFELLVPGGFHTFVLENNSTVAGTWLRYSQVPSAVEWGTLSLSLGATVISGGFWEGNTINPAYGGTGLTGFAAANNAIYSTSSTTLAAGTLPVAAGGTGLTAGTSGGVLYYSATGTLASSSELAASSIVLGGGAGAAPSTTTTGAGVVTALGVNTGTAGAFVVNGGALGTPSSGTLTNATGLPISSGVSGLGTNVATALAVNVGTAGAVVVNGGALGTPSSGTLTNATGLPISSGVSGLGTGVATALAVNADATSGFTTTNGTATLSNKRIDPRDVTATTASSLTPDVSAGDIYAYTALASGLTINAPIGTPTNGDKLIFRFLDNGTAQALTWNATYTVIGTTLPTTTTANKTTYVGCIYNANNTRWDVVAVATQA